MEPRRKRILFIEDDDSTRWLLRESFKRVDAEFTFAASASDGKEHIDRSQFDLIVCDYYLGDGVGVDIFKHLKTVSDQTPFILFTSIEDVFPEFKTDAFHFIQKPELGILLDRAKELLFKTK